ncbi:hypothetical protein [Sorangium sp. So ce233]|uniref:hypothetical protein n=1 Tax=Sorangium sp. So ce233 TaxID=3133290 RepID=UPI003F63CF5F
MKRPAALLAWAALAVAPSSAAAEEKPTISTEARAGWTVLGGERVTGGFTVGAGARYLQPLDGGPWGLYGGLGVAAVGVSDGWYWMGLLASPEAGAWWASGAWHISTGLGLPAGQLPTCTDWGLCIRSWGLYPEVAARIAVRGESVRIGLEASGMLVRTLPWSGLGGQVRIVGAHR